MTRHRSGTRRARYAVQNWLAHDRVQIGRGELTIWISPSALDAWRGGGGRLYWHAAIEMALTIRAVFWLALRQTKWLVGSIFRMLGLSRPVADPTMLLRRGFRLESDRRADAGDGVDLAIDSTGLRLWRGDAPPGRTEWRRLCVTIDPNTGTIPAEALTDGDVHDTQAVPGLLSRIDGRIDRIYGDSAYDGAPTYRLPADRCQPLPPGNRPSRSPPPFHCPARPVTAAATSWRQPSNRLKRVLGNRLRVRSMPAQQSEASIVAQALNRMTELGWPVTERIAR